MALQTDVAKNSLWRSWTVITPRTGGSNTHQNKGKSPMTQPNFKRPQLSNFGQKNSGSHGSFGGSGQKGASSSKGPWGQSKDEKADFKGSSKSVSFNNNLKREKSDTERNFESWNRAKKRLSTNEYNKRRKTNACINCGEVGHKFSECPKPKP